VPVTGRSQRYCSNSYQSIPAHTHSIWNFLIFEVYTLSKLGLWSLCLFLKIILIYI
jgi:hypothetical protein